MKKILKMTVWIILSLVILVVVVATLFINLSPQFGGSHSEADKKRYQNSGHYEDGKFQNLIDTQMDMKSGDMWATMVEFIKGVPNSEPKSALPVEAMDSTEIAQSEEKNKLYWFGHSAFLLKMDGKNILIDPMLGDVPAPHPWLGKNRYADKLPIEIAKLPQIDAVIISHDHYDHLDYGSIKELLPKVKEFYVPLGVGAHLKSWGASAENVHELNWWEEIQHDDSLKFAFTPSRHFSGRALTDRFATMWGSWVIEANGQRIYFSGDSGYGPHFKEIGEKYGPFDFAMMECGQYNEKWASIHMMPEETAQASVDLQAKVMMPIHWGAFTLALHSWTDPVERVTKKADELSMPYAIPKIGEEILLDSVVVENNDWWKEI